MMMKMAFLAFRNTQRAIGRSPAAVAEAAKALLFAAAAHARHAQHRHTTPYRPRRRHARGRGDGGRWFEIFTGTQHDGVETAARLYAGATPSRTCVRVDKDGGPSSPSPALAISSDGHAGGRDTEQPMSGVGDDPAVCAICLHHVPDAVPTKEELPRSQSRFVTACGHAFHMGCIMDLVGHHAVAPTDPVALACADDETVMLRVAFKTARCPLCRERLNVRYKCTVSTGFVCKVTGFDGQNVLNFFRVPPVIQCLRVGPPAQELAAAATTAVG